MYSNVSTPIGYKYCYNHMCTPENPRIQGFIDCLVIAWIDMYFVYVYMIMEMHAVSIHCMNSTILDFSGIGIERYKL